MDDIRRWFNGQRNYDAGVKLYLVHGKDPQLKRLFTVEGYTPFKLQKLTSALDAILSGKPVPVKSTPVLKTGTAVSKIETLPSPPQPKWNKDRDEVEQALWLQWKPVFAEMMNLMARIGDVARAGITDPAKEEEAGRMALRILDLDDMCDTLYYNRDYYQQYKELPREEKPIEISLDYLLWPKRLANHKRYVRKFKNDLVKDPSNIEKAALLQKHEWAVSEYEKLLKMRHGS